MLEKETCIGFFIENYYRLSFALGNLAQTQSVRIHHYHWCSRCSESPWKMRNEDVAEAMKQLKTNFKLHSESQMAHYTKMLEQYMTSMDLRFGQVHQKLQKVYGGALESPKSVGGGSRVVEGEGKELATYSVGITQIHWCGNQ